MWYLLDFEIVTGHTHWLSPACTVCVYVRQSMFCNLMQFVISIQCASFSYLDWDLVHLILVSCCLGLRGLCSKDCRFLHALVFGCLWWLCYTTATVCRTVNLHLRGLRLLAEENWAVGKGHQLIPCRDISLQWRRVEAQTTEKKERSTCPCVLTRHIYSLHNMMLQPNMLI